MLTRRVIPCLDVIRNRVTKGVRFQNNVDLGDPVELAARYYEEGCDELVVYDITASHERRPTDLEMVARVARAVRIPFAVGGGVSSVADMERVLLAGAEKVSVNSLAVANPHTRSPRAASATAPAWTRSSGPAAPRTSAPAKSLSTPSTPTARAPGSS